MRHIVNLCMIVVLLMSFVGCAVEDAGSRSTEPMAKIMWRTSKSHIAIVSSAIEDIVHANELLNIADEQKRAEYMGRYFDGATSFSEITNGFVITKLMGDSRISWVVTTNGHAFGQGDWTVEFQSGNGYTMVVRPNNGEYRAIMSFDYGSQRGSSDIYFSYTLVDGEMLGYPDVVSSIIGDIKVTVYEPNVSAPLCVDTEITERLTISEYNGLMSGQLNVDCIDKYYDAHDKLTVLIPLFKNYIELVCYGDSYQLFNERKLSW